MTNIGYQVQVPASPEEVFEHVTRFPVDGPPRRSVLEERYGTLLERDGDDYTFQDEANEELRWQCTFDPPRQRIMRIPESNWADRIDSFEPTEAGTFWTIVWELKTTGFRAYTQWLSFQLTGKRRTYYQVVAPVLQHFTRTDASPSDPPRDARGRAPEEPVAEAPTAPTPAEQEHPTSPETPDPPRGPRPRVRRRRRD